MLRKFATILATGGIALALVGAGLGASFTDSATATTSISVGTFTMTISAVAPTGGTAVVAPDQKSVTITCPDIQSSAAGHCLSDITVTNTGSIPMQPGMTVSTAKDGVAGAIAPLLNHQGPLPPVANPVLTHGQTFTVTGGFDWPALDSTVLGHSYSVTYTFSASA